jgi:hypothetical protein
MLGTNPLDANVMDTHIINKQRELISKNSSVNKEINKYLDALQISAERGEAEVNAVLAALEERLGRKLTEDEKKAAAAGQLEDLKETMDEVELRGVTVFFRDAEGKPCIGDHMIKGFLKAASEAICRAKAKANATILQSYSYTASIINQHVRISPQFITFDRDIARREDGTPKYNQRSLRAMTAQGPRVSLAKSEVVEAGAVLKFNIDVFPGSPLKEAHLKEMLAYGAWTGLGQWRNSQWGTFEYILKSDG